MAVVHPNKHAFTAKAVWADLGSMFRLFEGHSSTSKVSASPGAWLPTARTTPPLPAGMTSLRRTRQRPRGMETLWERRLWASCPRSEVVWFSAALSTTRLLHCFIDCFWRRIAPAPLLHVSRGTFDTAALVASGNVPVEYLHMYLKSLHGNQLEDCEKGRDECFLQ